MVFELEGGALRSLEALDGYLKVFLRLYVA
jgi:hypothetical protein